MEFVFRRPTRARTLRRRLAGVAIRASISERRGRSVVYLKGREEVATLLQLTGAHGALLEFAADQVGRDVQNRLNRLLNAEAANVNRTVRAADRQVRAIEQLDATHQLDGLSPGLRAVADARRAHPAEDLEALAEGLDISRSAVHHRLRRLEQIAATPPARRRSVGVSADRRPLVAGNWKMHPSDHASAVALARSVAEATAGVPVTVVVCPPAIWLGDVAAAVRGSGVAVGAQTMHAEVVGAFTGEISPTMVAEVASHVIVGHSERRRFAGETDRRSVAKVASAVRHGLVPIAAIGETAEERTAGVTEHVIDRQLAAAIRGPGRDRRQRPGHRLRAGMGDRHRERGLSPGRPGGCGADPGTPGTRPIPTAPRRSGSCTAAAWTRPRPRFFAEPDVDGALVGGASLDAVVFGAIVRAAAG